MKIYYAHCIALYGTLQESRDVADSVSSVADLLQVLPGLWERQFASEQRRRKLAHLLPDDPAAHPERRGASLSHGADVVAQSVSDDRPAGVITTNTDGTFSVPDGFRLETINGTKAIVPDLFIAGQNGSFLEVLDGLHINPVADRSRATKFTKQVANALRAHYGEGIDIWGADDASELDGLPSNPAALHRALDNVFLAGDKGPGVMLPLARYEEWHITVKGDPIAWAAFCLEHGLKPLYIELQGGALQLMCASSFDPRTYILPLVDANERPLFTILRVKHEVSALLDGETPLYYEAHVKFNGPWRVDRKGVSRDLFQGHEQRWYMTQRSHDPFNAESFAAKATVMARPSRVAGGVEYEVCILDTNPSLDGGWFGIACVLGVLAAIAFVYGACLGVVGWLL